MSELLGIDIGGTKCAVVLGTETGEGIEILNRVEFATPASAGAALHRLEETALQMSSGREAAPRALGISCGGPLDSLRGIIQSPPNLPGWDDVPIVSHFQNALNIPTFLQNDADACALAEWKWGAGRGAKHMAFLTFGTGLGAGLILNGQLYSGACGLGGELGHWRLADDGPEGFGKRGSFEGFCSGGGIARAAQEAIREAWARGESVAFFADESALENVTARAVLDASRAGDALARGITDQASIMLGRGLALLVDLLNLEMVVIGGVFMRAHDLLWPLAEAELKREAIGAAANLVQVVPAELGEKIGDYACLGVAANAVASA